MDAEQHEVGVRAARRFSQWHIGYPSWADRIIDAYLNPERAMRVLDEEIGDE